MSEPQTISPEELTKRRQAIDDAASMSPFIPDDLREQLEAGLTGELRTAVLQLQILAIKYGRALERRDLTQQPRIEMVQRGSKPSNLALKLVDKAGKIMSHDIHKVSEDKKVEILVAPGFLDVTTKH